MKYKTELSELMLLNEHGGILFCKSCKRIIGYINEKSYKSIKMAMLCSCGSTGYLHLYAENAAKRHGAAFKNKKPDVINSVYVCGGCGMQLFEIDDSRVDSCAFETVCSCGACYNGNSMFSKRLGETVEYLKRKGTTKE